MLDKLSAIEDRYYLLEEQMSDPEVVSDIKKFTKINKEYKDLKEIVDAFHIYRDTLGSIEETKKMLDDPEMNELAREELTALDETCNQLEEQLKWLLIPKDPEDSKDVIFEIRSGTGGDEASIFAGDLYRMYIKYFETQRWKTEVLFINFNSCFLIY